MGLKQKEENLDACPTNCKKTNENGQNIVVKNQVNELVFCLVGHIGSGTSKIAEALNKSLKKKGYCSNIIKASELINEQLNVGVGLTGYDRVVALQNAGDKLRKNKDPSIISRLFISKIRKTRALNMGLPFDSLEVIVPDNKKRAYILDSVKHPQEIEILRKVYRNAFVAIGVVCDEETRETRIKKKLIINAPDAADLMKRDAKDGANKNGQRVSDAFYLSDFFMDNSEEEFMERQTNPDWEIYEHLGRLVSIITHEMVMRPTLSETAMFHAHGARLKSACLSRQVGAALVDKQGEIISTGKNEVPRAGGGCYTDDFSISTGSSYKDERCYTKPYYNGADNDKDMPDVPYCSSDAEKEIFIKDVVQDITTGMKIFDDAGKLTEVLKNSRISSIIEFSRAIHAEMDAILSALRQGKSITGSKLFVTTFPCHYCARHIVAAGIDEVQFIEPYPKSLAYKLHRDSIALKPVDDQLPSDGGPKVVFRAFVGVAPRLYQRAFLKDRDLKDKKGFLKIGDPEWGSSWTSNKKNIPELELELVADI